MQIYWDITKMSKNRVFSGLNRVSQCLKQALEAEGHTLTPVAWSVKNTRYLTYPERDPIVPGPPDVFITPELFSDHERLGVNDWVKNCQGKCIAIFHDAIPLKHPEFTWPKSVSRHPYYLKDLLHYDLILANSEHSRSELEGYWQWLGVDRIPPVVAIPLGADFAGDSPRHPRCELHQRPSICSWSVFWNPARITRSCSAPWRSWRTQGKNVQLSIVGRINPHFGKPVFRRIETLIRSGLPIRYHRQIEDEELVQLYRRADLTLFPSLVEGNGLPIIESLWRGIPTLASPIPPHLEHAEKGGGVLIVDPMDAAHLAAAIDSIIESPGLLKSLQTEALAHSLPTWKDSANATLTAIRALAG